MLEQPVGVIAVDLDGDGVLDLVSANQDSSDVAVLMGNGDGTFAPDVRYSACGDLIGYSTFPTPGDFDENGTIDLAVTCSWLGLISILPGNGDGTFGPSAEYGDESEDPFVAQTGDFNNDDHLDLIAANFINGGSVSMYFGNGDGTFGPELDLGGGGAWTVAVGDFNGDNNDDYARPDGGDIEVHLGNGDGTFAPPVAYPGPAIHIVAVDLNDDANLDLVAADAGTQVQVLLGNGDGTFGTGQFYSTGENNANFVAVADYNGDQLLDLAVNVREAIGASLWLLFGTGGGQFAPAVGIDANRAGADSIAVGDFDLDGDVDIVRPCFYCDDLTMLVGDGSGGFSTSPNEDVGDQPSDVVVADLNGDGRPDLATSNEASYDVSVLLAEAAGTFEPEARYPARRDPSAIVTGEFTGDTLPDLMASNRAHNNLTLLTGTGGGGFVDSIEATVGTGPSDLVVGDFNEDDLDDLAVSNEGSNDVTILLGLGDGTFAVQPSVSVGTGPTSIVVASFDGDAHEDLAVANGGSHDVSVLLGTGSGTFTAAAPVSVGSGPTALAVGDIDGDDSTDLAVVHEGSDDLRIYSGNGDGSFTAGQIIPFRWPGNPLAVIVTDMNDDGLLDVAAGVGTRVDALINTGGGVLELESGFAVRSANGIAGADFNGDALQDLVSSGGDHGVLTVLLNQSGPQTLTFTADAGTLVWPAVIGALSYNVYRGNVAALVDIGGDGLPDSGYGTCMTALDPDPTDTFFDDPDTPAADAGFFYLRSVVDAGGEGGLGTTSAGLARVPTAACP